MNRGYDPASERVSQLLQEAKPYEPVCNADGGPGLQLPHPKTWMRVEMQNPWPSCGGHGGSSLAEYIYFLATRGDSLQLSRMFCWVQAQRVDGRPNADRGVSIYAVVKVLKEQGLPVESLAPYTPPRFYDDFDLQTVEDAAERKIVNSFVLDTPAKVFDFQESGMGGVIWGVPWEFNRRAWHCVCTIGTPQNGQLVGPNSWGPDWDQDGWFEWSQDKVTNYLRVPGVVCIGMSDMDTPQVRQGFDWTQGGLV